MIDSFSGKYAFLSNFYPAQIRYGGIYPTAEHAYQAIKTTSLKERFEIAQLATPYQAKRAGKKVTLRADWEDVKLQVMEEILVIKFFNEELAEQLIATGVQMLIEGNNWGDTFWGVCNGKGQNNLGRLLICIRAICRKKFPDIAAKYPLPIIDRTNPAYADLASNEDAMDIAIQVLCALADYSRSTQTC